MALPMQKSHKVFFFISNKRLLINNIQGTKLVLITYGRENLGTITKIHRTLGQS
jgi:hypothetical protein